SLLINKKVKRIYIPILRGLRPIQDTGGDRFNFDDSYRKRTISDYFPKINNESQFIIFSGLDMSNYVKECLVGSKDKRDLIREFEQFLSDKFFNDETSLIPRIDDDVLHIKIGDEEFPIHQLGDGIQSVISLTFQLFLNKNEQ